MELLLSADDDTKTNFNAGVLTEQGSIYVHIDWHVSHYLKIVMDDILEEIISGEK